MPAGDAGVTYHRSVLEEAEVAQLVASAANGEREAWDRLVETFSGLVWSVVRGHGVYGAEASDVFQTVWLRFVEHVGRLNHPGRPGAWLATTARHECYRISRRASRVLPSAEVPEVPSVDGADTLLDELERTGRREAVLAAVEKLPSRCQELLRVLGADPPLSYDEVAEILDMPKGSIGPTRGRCLDRLRRILADAAEAGPASSGAGR
jgi:RNA polymerase sigma factor (sigma-70 family)